MRSHSHSLRVDSTAAATDLEALQAVPPTPRIPPLVWVVCMDLPIPKAVLGRLFPSKCPLLIPYSLLGLQNRSKVFHPWIPHVIAVS